MKSKYIPPYAEKVKGSDDLYWGYYETDVRHISFGMIDNYHIDLNHMFKVTGTSKQWYKLDLFTTKRAAVYDVKVLYQIFGKKNVRLVFFKNGI